MEHYVTLFDSLFLPQGIALHASMQRHIIKYTLWVLCVDDCTYEMLANLKLPNMRLLQLSKIETAELLSVKTSRSKGEYCWTLSPFAPKFVFDTDLSIGRVTYLDADVWFRKDPKPIFDEFTASGKQVLITDHAYAAEYDLSATSGQYCVQFIIFTREGGEIVRKWWEDRCIEWCYARFEDGKLGDQMYLDHWPSKFEDLVHVLENKELALAPWNATRIPYGNSIFYHFHGLRILSEKKLAIGAHIYKLSQNVIDNIYKPYFKDLRRSYTIMGTLVTPQIKKAGIIKKNYRRIRSVYRFFRTLMSAGEMTW